jgi:hypothetical protein
MNSTPRASSSILVAAIFAILGGCLVALSNLAALILFSSASVASSAPFPLLARPVLYLVWFCSIVFALFIVVVGIQVMRLRNWARIAILIIAGCLLFFGLAGVGVLFMSFFMAEPPGPIVSRALLSVVLAVTYGIPIAVSLWWLILFTRRSVVAQFHSSAALAPPAPSFSTFRIINAGCPLAIRVVGLYLASFVLFLPFLPFIPNHLPAFFFGQVFHGPAAVAVFILNFALLFIPGFGLLLLKRWSFPLAVASQLLIGANSISATLSPAYAETVRAMLAGMNLPNLSPGTEQLLNYTRYFNLLSLIVPVALLITLFATQRKFYAAADRISKNPIDPSRNSTV